MWCSPGENLPTNREAFLFEPTQQKRELQHGSDKYAPICWSDGSCRERLSPIYIHLVLADTPEAAALSGKPLHAVHLGRIYCERAVLCICHRICYPYDSTAVLKAHAALSWVAEEWDKISRAERSLRPKSSVGTGRAGEQPRPNRARAGEFETFLFRFSNFVISTVILTIAKNQVPLVIRWLISFNFNFLLPNCFNKPKISKFS